VARSDDHLPAQPLLGGLYHVLPLGPDRVEVANAGRSVVLSGDGLAARLVPFLNALDGRTTLSELRDRSPDLCDRILKALLDKDLLTEGLDPAGADSIDTRLTASAFGLSPAEVRRRLEQAAVVVSGCGPVGGTAARHLAQAGVGRLVLVDTRGASAADLAASPFLSAAVLGQSLAMATRRLCMEASSEADIVTAPLLAEALAGIVGYGTQPGPVADAEVCMSAGVPHLLHTQDALEAVVGPLVGPAGHPCHRCLETRRRSHVHHLEEDLAYRRHRAHVAPESDAFLAAHTSLVGGLLATEALRALLDAEPVALGAALVVDLAALTVHREVVVPVTGCPGCPG